ncbi:hypothetical protein IZU99_09530 [Oscillospiraceae bacterium CM]|nr:hypothetical protein IZU99_09530 [Oscillospiraceae bacterium CM]
MVIDFHAHILPGMDHGCRDVQAALRQVAAARRAGVDIIAATSHFYPTIDTPERFLERRQAAWSLLKDALPEATPQIHLGAEVTLCDGMEQMEGLFSLALNGDQTILLEMPRSKWSLKTYDTVEKINDLAGGRAVIAHVDRYEAHLVESLFEIGVTGQLNAAGLLRLGGRRRLLRWIDSGKISALGSDAHGKSVDYRRYKRAQNHLGSRFSEIMRRSAELLTTGERIYIR